MKQSKDKLRWGNFRLFGKNWKQYNHSPKNRLKLWKNLSLYVPEIYIDLLSRAFMRMMIYLDIIILRCWCNYTAIKFKFFYLWTARNRCGKTKTRRNQSTVRLILKIQHWWSKSISMLINHKKSMLLNYLLKRLKTCFKIISKKMDNKTWFWLSMRISWWQKWEENMRYHCWCRCTIITVVFSMFNSNWKNDLCIQND